MRPILPCLLTHQNADGVDGDVYDSNNEDDVENEDGDDDDKEDDEADK